MDNNRILIPPGWIPGKGRIIPEAIEVMKYSMPGEYVLQDQPLRDAGGRYAVVFPSFVVSGKHNLIPKGSGTGEVIPEWWSPYGSFHRFAVEFALKTGRNLALWIRELRKVPLNATSLSINDMFFLKPYLVLKVGRHNPRDGPTRPDEINMWNFPLNIAYDSLRGYHGDGMRQASRAMRRRRRLPYVPPDRDQAKLG